jgi:carboxynorspermidine decarboxylase
MRRSAKREAVEDIATPAFIIDEAEIRSSSSRLRCLADDVGCKLLFSLKPLAFERAIRIIGEVVDGFSASSFFEARLAREILGDAGSLHLCTPGIRPDEIDELANLCDYVVFNSISQWDEFQSQIQGRAESGIRLNPELSLVKDRRYDPCRRFSRLGVSVGELVNAFERAKRKGLDGIHFHTNCDSEDFSGLLQTAVAVDRHLSRILEGLRWVNMGGGYIFAEEAVFDDFRRSVDLIRGKRDLEVFFEPGASFVRSAGTVVSSVLDIVTRDKRRIAILDTTVNHMPEVFEYQFEPDVAEHVGTGQYEYILAGCSCLAGDLFGDYSFNKPLKIGSRITFENVGAYSFVKANMFNGINLPSIYVLNQSGRLDLVKEFSFDDFASRCGFQSNQYANS